MSANDILDVLNVQRDQSQQQPAKKKQRVDTHSSNASSSQKGMARELYNLLGPNTPPINLSGLSSAGAGALGMNGSNRIKPNARPSPWTRMKFKPQSQNASFSHWMKGSKELLESEELKGKGYFFDKFNTTLSLPELVDKETYESYLDEFKEAEMKERERIAIEKIRLKERAIEKQREKEEKEKERLEKEKATKQAALPVVPKPSASSSSESGNISSQAISASSSTTTASDIPKKDIESADESSTKTNSTVAANPVTVTTSSTAPNTSPLDSAKEAGQQSDSKDSSSENKGEVKKDSTGDSELASTKIDGEVTTKSALEELLELEPIPEEFSYEETAYLFDLCKAFELKWYIITDRYSYPIKRSQEDLKEHYYRVCYKILEPESNTNPNLLESLKSFSKTKEVERKHYLENLLKRTPAEIAEEESLVIEARRFELAAKKMLVERSYLLNLLDSPQTSQSVQQYQSSQGLATLYSNLMIIDKHQKKRQQQQLQKQANANGSSSGGSANNGHSAQTDPVPPAIPIAASSSFKKERTFQTHLQQYLSGLLKQQGVSNNKHEPSPIQQLLSKRLTVKEEEAYGLHYHANDKIVPGVTLRSTQKLPGLQQRQSVLKSVNNLLQEMDIPTAGGTNWKPAMPTRKTMAKYDSLLRAVVALLDVKKGRDKIEAEIKLIKSQRNL
ncbi:SWR1-complex protein 4 [[Candida] railenensis]|uniref:SWR1-complex protein 4 n=1 Tax=[Candida] railenensis TaxID=45579 RepID=A0A9P0VXB8_9ASCO|nr:SWR1-complex protein 4 [[Candida] railenensis]